MKTVYAMKIMRTMCSLLNRWWDCNECLILFIFGQDHVDERTKRPFGVEKKTPIVLSWNVPNSQPAMPIYSHKGLHVRIGQMKNLFGCTKRMSSRIANWMHIRELPSRLRYSLSKCSPTHGINLRIFSFSLYSWHINTDHYVISSWFHVTH